MATPVPPPEVVLLRECEELFMASDDEVRARAAQLLGARWRELLGTTTPISRRARTMGTCASLREVILLAQYARHADDDDLPKSRGEKMLPNVSQEALSILRNDRALAENTSLREALVEALEPIAKDGSHAPTRAALDCLKSLAGHLELEYLALAQASLEKHFLSPKPSLVEFEEGVEQIASHARALGWSDEGLVGVFEAVSVGTNEPVNVLRALCARIASATVDHSCSASVDLGETAPSQFDLDRHGVHISEDNASFRIQVTVPAHDSWAAARAAIRRIAAIIGAPNVFQKQPSRLQSSQIVVIANGQTTEVDGGERLARDYHNPWKDQVKSIVEVAARAGDGTADTLYDAIRNHDRACAAVDVESCFVLLWSAIERLCADPNRPEPVLESTTQLVSGSLAVSKIRREVQNLADALTPYIRGKGREAGLQLHHIAEDVIRADRDVVSHKQVLEALLAKPDAAKTFCGAFYDNVLLTQWFFRLRRQLASQGSAATPASLSKRVPSMLVESRQRTDWQMRRLYRARNGLAHGGSRPAWLHDLARHANYFLTNLIAICLTYSSGAKRSSACDILKARCGRLDAYLALAAKADPKALSLDGLLKPGDLFGSGRPIRG